MAKAKPAANLTRERFFGRRRSFAAPFCSALGRVGASKSLGCGKPEKVRPGAVAARQGGKQWTSRSCRGYS